MVEISHARRRSRLNATVPSWANLVGDRSFEARIGGRIVLQDNGCWLYRNEPKKYGNSAHGSVHRVVYELLVGDIPEGHHLHHKCQSPGCCNPEHLEPLTPEQHATEHAALAGKTRKPEPKVDPYEALLGVLRKAG